MAYLDMPYGLYYENIIPFLRGAFAKWQPALNLAPLHVAIATKQFACYIVPIKRCRYKFSITSAVEGAA